MHSEQIEQPAAGAQPAVAAPEPPVEAAAAAAGPVQAAPCPSTDAAGRQCRRELNHDGPHAVEMEPLEVVYRQAVQAMVAHRNRTAQRSPLLTAREVKLDLILDNQVAILNGLAMVLDMGLQMQGLPGEIRILPKAGDGRA